MKMILKRLLALQGDLESFVAEPRAEDTRTQAAAVNALGAISHLRDCLDQDASVRKPGHPVARNRRGARA